MTERFFTELNTRRIDTSVARSETLSIINGMRYLKLGVCVTYHVHEIIVLFDEAFFFFQAVFRWIINIACSV